MTISRLTWVLVGANLILAGCMHSRGIYDDLKRFVASDSFEPGEGSEYPRPRHAPEALSHFSDSGYETEMRVRSILAGYFLDYDYRLLKSGLIDASFADGDLIAILWNKESPRNWKLNETASTYEMREHIRSDVARFARSTNLKERLARNDLAFGKLQRFWDSRQP